MVQIPAIPSLQEFLFGAPLYARYKLADDLTEIKIIYGRVTHTVDGYCLHCKRLSTFNVKAAHLPGGDPWDNVTKRFAIDRLRLECVRDEVHEITFYLLKARMTIMKVGQYPSLADISNAEFRGYRNILSSENSSELYKAIGLGAHGVGVGSFVYLRRVFERLIQERFAGFKDVEGWNQDEFNRKRMVEKIEMLKEHLPPFLVENRNIYSFLSLGIHELTEEACLGYFDVMKESIAIILEEDQKKKEELALRERLKQAISTIASSGESGKNTTESNPPP
jgi:hypothetical protein